jgi:hypothetical protein
LAPFTEAYLIGAIIKKQKKFLTLLQIAFNKIFLNAKKKQLENFWSGHRKLYIMEEMDALAN